MSTQMRERLTLLAYSAGWSAVRRVPDRVAYASFRRLADLAWRRRGPSVERFEANLARAAGSNDPDALRQLSRAGMRSYLRYWCDAFRLPDWDTDRVMSTIRVEGEHHVQRPFTEGRGVVAALPHMGNWDHAGAWGTRAVAPVTTVAERLQPEALYKRFLAYREQLGMEIVPLTGGPDDVFVVLSNRLSRGHLVPLLADRDLSRRGIEVTLLGERTRMPAGPAVLSLRTGAALVPASLWYEGDEPRHRLVVRFHDEITPPAGLRGAERVVHMTQALADVFSEAIREHPQDWHMLQLLFLADLVADVPAARS